MLGGYGEAEGGILSSCGEGDHDSGDGVCYLPIAGPGSLIRRGSASITRGDA